MKRTKSINLERMRKVSKYSPVKPLTLAVAASTLVACGESRDAKIYSDIDHCTRDNPSLTQECKAAYQEALAKSSKSGPKYTSQSSCVAEFGENNCTVYHASNGNNWFMPAMAGFMFSQVVGRNHYNSAPLYTSYSRRSPVYDRWSTVDGELYGKRQYGKVRVGNDVFKSKPAVVRTVSRGGFGSTVSAKSSWGGSSSKSGWGG